MAEITTAESYILRIYRVDTRDPNLLAGLVERIDGSGERVRFNDLEGLAAILNSSVTKPNERRRTGKRQGSRQRRAGS